MPVAAGGIARAVVTFLGDEGSTALNIYHARNDSGGVKTDTEVLDDFKAYLDSIHNDIMIETSNNATVGPYEVFDIDPATGDATPLGTRSPALQPSNTNEILPHGIAALVNADLSGTGRGSGKKFFPYWTEASNADGLWLAASLARLVLAAAAYLLDFGGVGGSDWTTGTWTLAKGFRELVSSAARDVPAYQRRRKPGVGV